MKKFLLIAIVFGFNISGNAQNEPELIASFEYTTFPKFVYIDHGLPKLLLETNESIELYNLDFTLYTSIDFPEADTNSYNRAYVTRSLFDCDTTNIEYLSAGGTAENAYIRIFREDGSTFFDLDNYQLLISTSGVLNESHIASDQNGSYITFQPALFFSDDDALMYKFCGQVPQPLARESDGSIISGIVEQENSNGFDVYPNPAQEIIRFEYDLQGYQKANLQLFNTSGQLMKEMMLGQAFNFIRLNISDLDQGTYIARITMEDGFELSEKFVKVD